MDVSYKRLPHKRNETFLSVLSAGLFLILVGMIFATTPNLIDKIVEFFKDFETTSVPNSNIHLPAPQHPWTHSILYSAAWIFSFVWGLFEIILLVLRFLIRSQLTKKAETMSNVVFWLGTTFLINRFLNETTTNETWFVFWATIIMLLGVSLIIRAIILAIARSERS